MLIGDEMAYGLRFGVGRCVFGLIQGTCVVA